MIDKTKITKLERAIKGKQEELKQVQAEKQKAAEDSAALVLAEKQERRITEQIKALKEAKQAVEYRPPEPTDKAELLRVFDKYYSAKAAKVQKVTGEIKAAENRLITVNRGLQLAAVEADTEKTVELSGEKADLEKRLVYLRDMSKRVKGLEAFTNSDALEEWKGICEKVKPDFDNSLLRLETLATEYKAACSDFLKMYDTLTGVRNAIKQKETAEGLTPSYFSPILTVGMDTNKLSVEKSDYSRVRGILNTFTGNTPL
ncbi:MAG: hypothetical protein LUD81_04265 [Clostridiales bacterium]|nr:hypothetical protein [Clostridiales bacterium]